MLACAPTQLLEKIATARWRIIGVVVMTTIMNIPQPLLLFVMATKKRVEITIETERIIIAPSSSVQPCLWCDSCLQQVEMVTPEQAATEINVPPRLIYRWIEAGKLHFREDHNGAVLICRNSLFGDQPLPAQLQP